MNYLDLTLEKKIKQLVAQETEVRVEKLALETRLLEDLGVDGDDAFELLEKYSETFKVDFSKFQFSKYFGQEAGLDILSIFFYLFFPSHIPQSEPLTIQDLVDAANIGEIK